MIDPEPGDDTAELDAIGDGLRQARPAHHDVGAALARSRVAAALFGRVDPVCIGRYVIESRVGGGGGGEVYVARDPELSRRVAIKLLRASGDRDRQLREGHALARLSHPNIVPIYDAGAVGDQVYVVMELVEGDTLRAYCEAPVRTIADIVRAYRQAGDGLAAAHRAGFIHRDFKPDNALVGRDGRVRVVDFGLAHGGPPETAEAGLGTPRYMAPEQARGAVLTAAADQYAFCVSLRDSVGARAPSLPGWLDAIVRRGLADSPADRYPSMDALLDALARDPAWRWRRRAIVAGALGLAATAFVVGRVHRDEPSCDRASAEVEAMWGQVPAARIAARLAGLSPYGRAAAGQATAMLDRYATSLGTGYRDACVAQRDGAQSPAMFDHRVACLTRARAALGTAVSVVEAASAAEVAGAIAAIGELPDLARCTAPSTLIASVAPPPPGNARAVAELDNQLASLEVEIRAARPGAATRIEEAVQRARALEYPPLLARALRLEGKAAIAVDRRNDAVPPLREATTLALTASDHALGVEAFAVRLWAAGTTDPTNAFAGVELVQAIAAGLPASERATRALLDNAIGSVELASGRRDKARTAFERAVASATGVTGPAALELAELRSNLALVTDDPVRRRALAQERIAIVEAGLGADHPTTLDAQIAAARLETDPRRARAGLVTACNRLAEFHPEYGRDITACQITLGWLAFERGDTAEAERAFAIAVTHAGDETSADVAIARAYVTFFAGRRADAERALDAALTALGPLDGAAWYVRRKAAVALLARGAFALSAGRDADARRDLDAARGHFEVAFAVSPSVATARQLAFARAALVRSWRGAPLPADARAHADAALAWYRTAGGYDDAIAELERAR